jgi:hypothetical protein
MSDYVEQLRKDAQGRPEPMLAAGHLLLAANDVAKTASFLERLGLMSIVVRPGFAVLELRGGTHVVVQKAEQPVEPGSSPGFDLMVDDVEAMRERCLALGADPSPIEVGDIHSSFAITDPSGQRIDVVSSHTIWKA